MTVLTLRLLNGVAGMAVGMICCSVLTYGLKVADLWGTNLMWLMLIFVLVMGLMGFMYHVEDDDE